MITCAVLTPILAVSDKPSERVIQQRAAARAALARCARMAQAPSEGWLQNADGAPLPNIGFFWSLSHKRHWAGAVIARTPVGIDIEEIAPRSNELYDKVGAVVEWHRLGGRTWSNFFRLWTAKEATLKANSVGIGYLGECRLLSVKDPMTLTVSFGETAWTVQQLIWQNHIAAVAGSEPVQWEVIPKGTHD
jgi:4'-phosphopantetheinyl transferase EntD